MLSLPRLVQASLAVTVVFMVLGSGSVHALRSIGTSARWVALVLFVVLALLWVVRDGGDVGRLGAVAIPGGLLLALAFISTVWSVAPLLSFERSVSLGIVFLGGIALASVRQREVVVRLVAEAIVGATTLVCVAGAFVYAFVPAEARQAPNAISPFRWSGLGENPDTVQLLAALAILPAALLAVTSSGRRRAAFLLAFAVLGAQIIASGSRDGAISAAFGLVVFAVLAPSTARARVACAAIAIFAGGILVGGVAAMNLTTRPATAAVPPSTSAPPAQRPPTRPHPRIVLPSMDYEFGTLSAAPRSFLVTGGRGEAIREGIDQADKRPVAGWGFGTESRVFINRVAAFRSNLVEDTYVGFYLQLGALGPLLFLALGLGLAWIVVRNVGHLSGRHRIALAALAGTVAAGYALGVGQSYAYVAGNVGTTAFWVAAFLLAAIVPSSRRGVRSRRVAFVAGLAALTVFAGVATTGRAEGASTARAAQLGIAQLWQRAGARIDLARVDGFREFHPYACLLYAGGGSPYRYEFCFYKGSAKAAGLVDAIERGPGLFRVSTLRPFGPGEATIRVSSQALTRELLALGAGDPTVVDGPAYLGVGR